jgi:hypothetical protein
MTVGDVVGSNVGCDFVGSTDCMLSGVEDADSLETATGSVGFAATGVGVDALQAMRNMAASKNINGRIFFIFISSFFLGPIDQYALTIISYSGKKV